ncbi:MAG: DUF2513 domain-containing protein [Thermoguttaceae bacterium]|nr:DUF2513 domain-containing protein [Thermoguttaceae bacterium]
MKRDMDLIKAILLDLEKHCNGTFYYAPTKESVPYDYDGDDEDFRQHCRLVAQHGLAKATETRGGISFLALTWDGHDFLDNSREPKVWNAAKKAAGSFSFGIFMKVLVEVATRYAMSKIENF